MNRLYLTGARVVLGGVPQIEHMWVDGVPVYRARFGRIDSLSKGVA